MCIRDRQLYGRPSQNRIRFIDSSNRIRFTGIAMAMIGTIWISVATKLGTKNSNPRKRPENVARSPRIRANSPV